MTDEDRWRALGRLEGEITSLTAETARLRTELIYLRSKIDKPKPRLERIAGGLALVALVFSLMKFPADFINAYVTRTATELVADDQIVFAYNAGEQLLEVRWKVDIQNDGNKQERLQIVEALIVVPPPTADKAGKPQTLLTFDVRSSGFRPLGSETAAAPATRIFVDEKKPNSVYAVLRVRVPEAEIRTVTDQSRSRRCITLKLDGRDSSIPIPDGCFDLFPSDRTGISSGEEFSITFDKSTT